MGPATVNGCPGACICALGLAICLMGCQPQTHQAQLPPPPPPRAATPPQVTRPTLYVTINQLSLRACPGTDCHKITTLKLNAEVEKMGETQNWTQVRVKKDGTIGYVSSRYLSPQPLRVAQPARKKLKKARPPHAAPEVAEKEGEDWPKKQEPAPPLPRVM